MITQEQCRRITALFQDRKIYLVRGLRLKDLARMLGVGKSELETFFQTYLNTTFMAILTRYRALHARSLVVEDGFPYKEVWKLSGFKSHKDFERGWNKVVN